MGSPSCTAPGKRRVPVCVCGGILLAEREREAAALPPCLAAALQVWSVIRGKGKKVPSGGTLVVGREQDCEGGCFDSETGEPQA